jgi:hypothetical protein
LWLVRRCVVSGVIMVFMGAYMFIMAQRYY